MRGDLQTIQVDRLEALREEMQDLLAKVGRWELEGVVALLYKEVRTLEKMGMICQADDLGGMMVKLQLCQENK